jgi:hypothetical protein
MEQERTPVGYETVTGWNLAIYLRNILPQASSEDGGSRIMRNAEKSFSNFENEVADFFRV